MEAGAGIPLWEGIGYDGRGEGTRDGFAA